MKNTISRRALLQVLSWHPARFQAWHASNSPGSCAEEAARDRLAHGLLHDPSFFGVCAAASLTCLAKDA